MGFFISSTGEGGPLADWVKDAIEDVERLLSPRPLLISAVEIKFEGEIVVQNKDGLAFAQHHALLVYQEAKGSALVEVVREEENKVVRELFVHLEPGNCLKSPSFQLRHYHENRRRSRSRVSPSECWSNGEVCTYGKLALWMFRHVKVNRERLVNWGLLKVSLIPGNHAAQALQTLMELEIQPEVVLPELHIRVQYWGLVEVPPSVKLPHLLHSILMLRLRTREVKVKDAHYHKVNKRSCH